jgi:ankyrin repeat protein
LNNGADINSKIERGWTPLSLAVGNGNLENVEYLLHRGAHVDSLDENKQTPLHDIIVDISDLTIKYPVDDFIKIIKKLLEYGADINLKDLNDETPLDLAKKFNNSELISIMKFAGKRK